MEILTSTQHLNTLLKTNLAGKLVQAAVLLCRRLGAQLLLHTMQLPQQHSLFLLLGIPGLETSGFPRWFIHTLWRGPRLLA